MNAPDSVQTIVSPDVVKTPAVVNATSGATAPMDTVILVPMAEWKQSAQRGVRTFIQAFIFLGGGGTVVGYLNGLGIPPASVANLPSTGQPLLDAVAYSFVFGLVVFLWNFIEFWLDIDIRAPKWRA